MFKNKRIFISALDWGLGHATRCTPLIHSLKKENEVILGVTPLTSLIFEEEFPELKKINVPAYNIRYSGVLPVGLKLLLDTPAILAVIKQEKKVIEKFVAQYKTDIVISDSRFGLYSKQTKNIFITHQVFLKSPFLNGLAQKINKFYLKKFDELWIPDYEDGSNNLSGELSHGNQFHRCVKFIGPLSRLEKIKTETKYDCLLLLSGPEPQQSILREELVKLARKFPAKTFVMVTPTRISDFPENVTPIAAPQKELLQSLISSSDYVICRSGYSTLMDMNCLEKKKLILIATPGQTEQEYLAAYWKKNKNAKLVIQSKLKDINLSLFD